MKITRPAFNSSQSAVILVTRRRESEERKFLENRPARSPHFVPPPPFYPPGVRSLERGSFPRVRAFSTHKSARVIEHHRYPRPELFTRGTGCLCRRVTRRASELRTRVGGHAATTCGDENRNRPPSVCNAIMPSARRRCLLGPVARGDDSQNYCRGDFTAVAQVRLARAEIVRDARE